MKCRNPTRVACFLTMCFLMVLPYSSPAEESRIVNIIENDWPPFYFAGKPESKGMARELLEMCIPKTGFDYKFTFYPVKRMYAYLEKGEIDVAVFSYKTSRESFVIYGKEPIFSSGYRPVVRAGENIEIRSIRDFDDLRVGHLIGLKYSEKFLAYIEKREKAGTLVTATAGNSCIRMLLAGMIDVFVDTRETILWRAKQLNALDKIRIVDLDIRSRDYFVTLSKNTKIVKDGNRFLKEIDQCLGTAKKDGEYDDIAAKYGLKE